MRIARKVLTGAFFIAASNQLRQAITIVQGMVLRKTDLDTTDFGVVQFSMLCVMVVSLMTDWGIDKALIKRGRITTRTLGTFLTLKVGMGLVPLVVSPIAFLFRFTRPETPYIIVIFAFFRAIEAVGFLPDSLIRKEMRFRSRAIVQVAAMLAQATVSIGLVWNGFGLWSLVAGSATYSSAFVLGSLIARPTVIRPVWDRAEAREFFTYCWPLWVAQLPAFIMVKFDELLAWFFWGYSGMALYTFAFSMSKRPVGMLAHPLAGVAQPTLVQLVKDRARLSLAFNYMVSAITRLILPTMLVLGFVTIDFIYVMARKIWLPAVLPFRLLLGVMLLRGLFDISGEVFNAVGHTKYTRNMQIIPAVVLVAVAPALTVILIMTGVETVDRRFIGVAVALELGLLGGVTYSYSRLRRFVDINYRRIFAAPVLAAAAAGCAYLPFRATVYAALEPATTWGHLGRGLTEGMILFGLYSLVLIAVDHRYIREAARFIRDKAVRREAEVEWETPPGAPGPDEI